MTELERALVQLGRELDVPPAPDLTAAVRARVARRRRRPWLVVALAVLAAAAIALAVPPARSAILRFFHIRGADVALVDRLPPVPPGPVSLGAPATLADADWLLLPDGRRPTAVYRSNGGYWLRYPGLLLYEFPSGDAAFLKKVAAGRAKVEYVDVGGDPGIWIGAGHVVYLPGGQARHAGRTLLWQHGRLTLRLEADVTKARAIALALSIR
jgi:hypothetical protein